MKGPTAQRPIAPVRCATSAIDENYTDAQYKCASRLGYTDLQNPKHLKNEGAQERSNVIL